MKLNKFLFLSFTLPFVLCSCTGHYKIEGTSSVNTLDGRRLYLQSFNDGKWVKLDSAEIVHGKFSMSGTIDSTRMVTLYMGDVSVMPFVLEDGRIKIELSDTEFKASGSKLNNAFYEFIDHKNDMDIYLSELDRKEARLVLDGVDLTEAQKMVKQEQDSLVAEMNKSIKTFIADNYENVLGPTVFMMLCSNFPYPVMTPEIDAIVKDAPYSFKNNKLIKEYLSKAKDNMQMLQEHRMLEQSNVAH